MKPSVFRSRARYQTTQWVASTSVVTRYFTTWKEALAYANALSYSNAMELFKSGKYTHTNGNGEDV